MDNETNTITGRFFTAVDATYMYGVLLSGAFSGMSMDIDRLLVSQVQKDGNNELRKAYNQLTGAQSSLNENLVPEQFFNDPNAIQKNAEGVSAVKLLKLAAESGQTIYQIDQSNIDVVLPKLQHSAMVLQDVKNGVAAGKVVTISQRSINFKGWVGSGYTVLDKNTGTGAYMISGGMNGSFIAFAIGFILGTLLSFTIAGILAATTVSGGVALGVLIPLILVTLIPLYLIAIDVINKLSANEKDAELNRGCFVQGLLLGSGLGVVSYITRKLALTALTKALKDSATEIAIISSISGFLGLILDLPNPLICIGNISVKPYHLWNI